MKKRMYSDRFYNRVRTNRIYFGLKYCYKFSPDSLEIIKALNERKKNLTSDICVIPEIACYNSFENYFGHASRLARGYKTLVDTLNNGELKITNEGILKEVKETMDELERIGFLYYDIHDRNILVKDNKIKIIDFDDVYDLESDELFQTDIEVKKVYQMCNIADLMLELYLFYEHSFPTFIPIKLLTNSKTKELVSKEFIEYLHLVNEVDLCVKDIPYEPFMEELKDTEKADELRKILLAK